MKNYIIALLLLFSLNFVAAQSYIDAIKWEATTKNKDKFIGITETKLEALKNIESLTKKHRNSNLEIINFTTRFAPVKSLRKDEDIFMDFKNNSKHILISKNDFIALKVLKKQGFKNALNFYMSSNSLKDKVLAEKKLQKLVYNTRFMLKISKTKGAFASTN